MIKWVIKWVLNKEFDSKGVEDLSKRVDNPGDSAELIDRIKRIMMSEKNNILILAYHQGIIFKKHKENNRFTNAVARFKIIRATINFEIGIIKFIEYYTKMKKTSISLHFLKNNFRLIKEVCKEHASECNIFSRF